ncbi:MAG: bifunctional phosphopantothenoylcysteine decarboxylase/phosphopantothenate--cysteine ligase CoaBC [Polyangia bacterium]|jgi:phosphopantothenoylcysteine decarboxylase/phosphopantothenate--cysteine ligase|nr:bifunctional phosphopantothenoylcysteine decarboxylase/phosphopantothenate--cysteine ligase CoaBC [Polyangia bacterium]
MATDAKGEPLVGRRIILGVTGGIAAYKSAELCRRLVGAGAEVHCVMTEAATKLVGPITFEALSGNPVGLDAFASSEPGAIEHIRLASLGELVVVAPATASFMARYASGLAEDLLGALLLATKAPVLLAPGMNTNMWEHSATQANAALLRQRGARFVGPEEGDLACRTRGVGRMAEPDRILEAAEAALAPQDLVRMKVLVTAGATREALDPVRFLSNHSTGKMGFALARAAASRGAKVVLVSGPTSLPTPLGVERVDVLSAEEMASAVLGRSRSQDVIVKAAAVTDWRPATPAPRKLKKGPGGGAERLILERTPDILASLGGSRRGGRPILVGFAAETGDPTAEAERKLEAKGCDLVVGNDVTAEGAGFGADTNRVVIVGRGGPPEQLPLASKATIAHALWDRVATLLVSPPRARSKEGVGRARGRSGTNRRSKA